MIALIDTDSSSMRYKILSQNKLDGLDGSESHCTNPTLLCTGDEILDAESLHLNATAFGELGLFTCHL